MNSYQVTPSSSPFARNLTFFKDVVVLVNSQTGKKYCRYILKKKQLPSPSDANWSVEQPTISGTLVKQLKAGQSIDSVSDEHGNIFYDVTEDL